MVPLASESIRVCPFSWFRRPLNNAVTLPVTTKSLNNKSTQTATDREADLDLDVKLGFDNTSQRFFFCSVAIRILERNISPASLCAPFWTFSLPSSLCRALTRLLEIVSVAWGALLYLPSVRTIGTPSGQAAAVLGSTSQMWTGTHQPHGQPLLF